MGAESRYTGQFAVNGARLWLDRMGRERYPSMTRLMITADGGGSNGSRLRLWKVALQQLADETGLIIQVCHYPPGTSKWNKIDAPHVLPHYPELARHASRQPPRAEAYCVVPGSSTFSVVGAVVA